MSFHIGQRVVCIAATSPARLNVGEVSPIYLGVYTIRSIDPPRCGDDFYSLRFEELINPLIDYGPPWGVDEASFATANFRPLVERKTNIEVFQKMLTPHQAEAV